MTTPARNLVSDAYTLLKNKILKNELPPGIQMTEPEVTMMLGMSRTPVREALVKLETEGLIKLIPRKGVFVLPIYADDMREIYEILTVLEPEVVARLAKRGLSEVESKALKKTVRDMEKALENKDLDKWATADDAFHREILRIDNNKRLQTFVGNLFDQAHRTRIITLKLRDLPTKSTQEHAEILEAILERNGRKARTIFRKHRERAARELLSILDKLNLSHL